VSLAIDRFREVLRRFVGKNELIEVYEDDDDDKFEVGYVISVSEDTYSLNMIDSKGRFNGIFVGSLEEVRRLASGTQYLASIQLLNERFKSGDRIESNMPPGPFEDMDDLLKYAHKHRLMTAILTESYFYGYVMHYTKEHLELLEVNKAGIEDGIQYLDREEITRIDFGGPVEDARQFLHSVRMGL
jgi:hypothetical protein